MRGALRHGQQVRPQPGVVHEVAGAWAHACVLRQHRLDEVDGFGRHGWRELDGGLEHDALARLALVLHLEGWAPHQQLVRQHTAGPDVALQHKKHIVCTVTSSYVAQHVVQSSRVVFGSSIQGQLHVSAVN